MPSRTAACLTIRRSSVMIQDLLTPGVERAILLPHDHPTCRFFLVAAGACGDCGAARSADGQTGRRGRSRAAAWPAERFRGLIRRRRDHQGRRGGDVSQGHQQSGDRAFSRGGRGTLQGGDRERSGRNPPAARGALKQERERRENRPLFCRHGSRRARPGAAAGTGKAGCGRGKARGVRGPTQEGDRASRHHPRPSGRGRE